MLNVKSLKSNIVLQLAFIVFPLATILLYQTVSNIYHSDGLARSYSYLVACQSVKFKYTQFINGVVDAVDSGQLGAKSLQALEEATAQASKLVQEDPSSNFINIYTKMDNALAALRHDRSLSTLMSLREMIKQTEAELENEYTRYENDNRQTIEANIVFSRIQNKIVIASIIVILLLGLMVNRLITRSITGREQAEAALKETESKFRSLAEESLVGVYIVQDGLFKYVNPKISEIFGYAASELLDGKGPIHLVLPDDWPTVAENLRRRLAGEVKSLNFQFRGVTSDNAVIHLEVFGTQTVYQGRPAVIGTLLDVTERKQAEEEIHLLAFYDVLTKLPNRRLLLDRLNQALANAKRSQRSMALMFLDLDNFKQVNDNLGHHVGDELLKVVADRLVACVRTTDTVCRQSGDEFIVILTDIDQPLDVAVVENKIVRAISVPIYIQGNELRISISIGIAILPANGAESADDLMKDADMAMYEAKKAKRNR